MRRYDVSALGSDVPRSYRQYLARRWAAWIVGVLGLNRPGFLSTEIVQQIHPLCTIPTRRGPMRCVGGHGRLRWRALTFYTEEPDTIRWLDALTEHDVLWDIGANVGLYAMYAAKIARCRVVAFEPEAQNYALLLQNMALNGVQALIDATNIAVTNDLGLGWLSVHAMTKGGAYNAFHLSTGAMERTRQAPDATVAQVQVGASLDDLVTKFHFPFPTHLKIDVDGTEPDIVAGGSRVLSDPRCVSVLIEVQWKDPAHVQMVERLEAWGYRCAVRSSPGRYPAANMVFERTPVTSRTVAKEPAEA